MGFGQMSDSGLVDYVETHRDFAAGALIEMQRRQILATREFNQASGKQANTMIRLTAWIIALTVILGFIAGLQLLAMLAKGA